MCMSLIYCSYVEIWKPILKKKKKKSAVATERVSPHVKMQNKKCVDMLAQTNQDIV